MKLTNAIKRLSKHTKVEQSNNNMFFGELNGHLEKSTNIEIKPSKEELELKMEDSGINKASIMQELVDEFGFDLIFDLICENRLKDLKDE